MADNRVIIYVVSENKTKAGFDQAKADAEKAGDDAGQGFVQKFASWLTGGQTSAGGGGIGGILKTAFSAGPVGIAAIAAAASALLVEVDGLVSGFAAAGAGAGAFYLLGHQTISNLISDYSALNSAQVAVQKAQDKYNLDPTKANLKALQTAQLNQQATQQVAQQDLGAAAPSVDKFAAAMGNLQQQFQPQLFKTMSLAFDDLTKLLPLLLPLANAFAKAIDGLLVQFGKFASSKQFQDWFKQFLTIVGPATTAIGQGLGQVTIAFGKLMTILSQKDVVNAIKIAFDVLTGALMVLAQWINIAMKAWDWFWKNIKEAIGAAKHSFGQLADAFKWAFNGIADWFMRMGIDIVLGLIRGIEHAAPGLLAAVGKLARMVGGFFGHLLGISSPSTVFAEHGRQIVAGLVQGIDSSTGRATAAVGRLAASAGAGGFGAGGGGGGGSQLVMNWGSPQTQALVRMLWPNLQLEVRARGGGGPKSAQIALGQTH